MRKKQKRIADLEKECAELKADNYARKFAMAMSEKVEKQLQKENAELRRNEFNARSCLELQQSQDKAILNFMGEQLTKAKKIMNIAIEGIKHWGVVGGTERPFEKQAEMLFNLFLDKAEQFLKEMEK